MTPEDGESVPVAARAPLDYAGRPDSPPAPVGRFVFGAALFGITHWAVDCLVTRLVFGERLVRDRTRMSWTDPYWSEQFYELGLTAASVLIAIGVQWAWWRLRPTARPRPVGFVAVAAGLAYCGASWGMYELSLRPPFNLDAAQAAVKFAMAAGVGALLAWWRGRGSAIAPVA